MCVALQNFLIFLTLYILPSACLLLTHIFSCYKIFRPNTDYYFFVSFIGRFAYANLNTLLLCIVPLLKLILKKKNVCRQIFLNYLNVLIKNHNLYMNNYVLGKLKLYTFFVRNIYNCLLVALRFQKTLT
jgi:hypothetical protein